MLGTAVYNHPGLTSDQPLEAFFRHPQPPDLELYELFRKFLLVTSQINGNFSTEQGIGMTLEPLGRKMLAESEDLARFVSARPDPELAEVLSPPAAE